MVGHSTSKEAPVGSELLRPHSPLEVHLARKEEANRKAITLSDDNPISIWRNIENGVPELASYQASAEKNLESLITKLVARLKNDRSPVSDKIIKAYNILAEEGYKPESLESEAGQTFAAGVSEKKLDCDLSSVLVAGIAHHLGWKGVRIAVHPKHAFIRYDGQNFDMGRKMSDASYAESYGEEFSKRIEESTIDSRELAKISAHAGLTDLYIATGQKEKGLKQTSLGLKDHPENATLLIQHSQLNIATAIESNELTKQEKKTRLLEAKDILERLTKESAVTRVMDIPYCEGVLYEHLSLLSTQEEEKSALKAVAIQRYKASIDFQGLQATQSLKEYQRLTQSASATATERL